MAKYKKVRSHTRRRKKSGLRHHLYSAVESIGRQGLQERVQDTLEAERDEILGGSSYERLPAGGQGGYRNGHHKTRCFVCGSGTIEVRVPRLEPAYESKIVPRYERMSPEMKQLLPELYLHGLSTGDMEVALGWLLGEGAPLSPGTIVRLKAKWEQEYRAWQKRPLEKENLYVWADGISPKGGPLDETLCLLVVLGVTPGTGGKSFWPWPRGIGRARSHGRTSSAISRAGGSGHPRVRKAASTHLHNT